LAERLGGVRAIDALIDVSILGENATKVSRFANYLRDVFQPGTDALTMSAAAKALGHADAQSTLSLFSSLIVRTMINSRSSLL
ncbi:MAG: hypothetical protein ACC700_18780, partial [Anaerolineales bacterium]